MNNNNDEKRTYGQDMQEHASHIRPTSMIVFTVLYSILNERCPDGRKIR